MKEFVLRNKDSLTYLGIVLVGFMFLGMIILSFYYNWANTIMLVFSGVLLLIAVGTFLFFAIFMPIKTIINTEQNHKKKAQK